MADMKVDSKASLAAPGNAQGVLDQITNVSASLKGLGKDIESLGKDLAALIEELKALSGDRPVPAKSTGDAVKDAVNKKAYQAALSAWQAKVDSLQKKVHSKQQQILDKTEEMHGKQRELDRLKNIALPRATAADKAAIAKAADEAEKAAEGVRDAMEKMLKPAEKSDEYRDTIAPTQAARNAEIRAALQGPRGTPGTGIASVP
jgi:regulator of replication initiation timing